MTDFSVFHIFIISKNAWVGVQLFTPNVSLFLNPWKRKIFVGCRRLRAFLHLLQSDRCEMGPNSNLQKDGPKEPRSTLFLGWKHVFFRMVRTNYRKFLEVIARAGRTSNITKLNQPWWHLVQQLFKELNRKSHKKILPLPACLKHSVDLGRCSFFSGPVF